MILRARRRSRPERLIRDRWGGSYLPMVALLFLLILVGPSLSGRGLAASLLVAIVELGAAALGILGATDNPKKVRNLILISMVAVIIQFAGDRAAVDALLLTGKILVIVVLFYVQSIILRDILPEPSVTLTTIVGAVGTYLLSIVYWATIFSALSGFDDGAFGGSIGSNYTVMNFLYFSSVTQTTLGYGDIVPVSSFARSLASLQAIIGQLYVAILVAWLVGRAVSQRET